MKKILSVLLSAALFMTSLPLGAGTVSAQGENTTSSLRITGMQTDHMTDPIGIDSTTPVFSWKLADTLRGQKQTAYRIRVATSEGALNSGSTVWDSTLVASDETIDIPYAGASLAPSTRYWWQVEVCDKDGLSAVSDPAFFETGLMDAGWSGAKWISRSEPKSDGYFALTNFSLDFDYTIKASAASVLFGGTGDGDFYMWQISAFDWHSDLRLRPHRCQSGGFSELASATLESTKANAYSKHHMTIECTSGTVKTYHDGVLKDTRTISGLELGFIGFRSASPESFTVDNLSVKDGSGKVLLNATFDDGDLHGFTGISIANGELSLDSSKLSKAVNLRKTSGTLKSESAPMFRKEFTVNAAKTVRSARLYATSAGVYDAYINGSRVTDSVLNPGMTAYDDHMLYQTFDVTELMQSGKNAIGVYLGHGWFNRALRGFGSALAFYGKLLITYTDGTSDVIVSDESWNFYRYGPILDDDIFNGFKYDAQIEKTLDGWNMPGYDDSAWDAPTVLAANKIVSNGQTPSIISQNLPLIRPTMTLPALSVTEPEEGVYIYDFGQNIAGVVRVTASAAAGTKLTMRHAEMLNRENMSGATGEPGTLYTGNLPRADATDTYVFRGDKESETFEPFFTYHGFRYLEITGLDEPLALENVTALLLMSDLAQTSSFESSNELVNRLYLNSLWSARDNFMSVPTDCPQRGERFGWTGDAQIFARTGSYLMDVNAFYRKYCMDMRDTSTNNRIIADVSPASVGNGWYGMGDRKGATNGWGDAIIIIPYQMYMQYGNRSVLTENYETMCNWMDYLVSTSTDYVRDQSWTGDWLPVGEPKSPIALTDTAFCAYSASLLSEISTILGKSDKAAAYHTLYENYRSAWRSNFLVGGKGGETKCGTQTSYVLGLNFGLFDENEKAEAAENLAKNIQKHSWHLTTGFLGLSYLNPVLSDNGYSEVAYKLLEQEEYPSWLYSVTTGSTTIWESWYALRTYADGSSAANGESFNHFSYGAVSEWLFRYVLGIERDKNAVAYKHILLKPEFGGSFTRAGGSYNSVRGTIESSWTLDKDNGAFAYTATVPANTTATLFLPVASASTIVTESGRPASAAEGVTYVGYADGCMVYELESGSYSFRSTVDPQANALTAITFTNAGQIEATLAVGDKSVSAFPASFLSSEPVNATVQSKNPDYTFLRFVEKDGTTAENGAVLAGDHIYDLLFAYTGADDGKTEQKTITLSAQAGVTVAIDGEAVSLPYTTTVDKGTELKIEVLTVPKGYEVESIGGIMPLENTVHIKPLSDWSASIVLRKERYRKGIDLAFTFDDDIGLWTGGNAQLSWSSGGYMRFEAIKKSDNSFDPRAGYNFTASNETITGGAYVPANKYSELTIGYIADRVASDSTPVMYIATEDKPSYTNPVRQRSATSKLLASYADGKTAREIKFSLADWSAWNGNIKEIYLDILDNVDGDVRVDYIVLKRADTKLTIKTEGKSDVVYTYEPGTVVDLTTLPAYTSAGFVGFTRENGSDSYLTEITMDDDITLYAVFTEVKLPCERYDFNTGADGWKVNNAAGGVANGAYKLTFDTAKNDAWLYNESLSLDAASLRYAVIKMRHNVPSSAVGTKSMEAFFIRTTDVPWQAHLMTSVPQKAASTDYQTYIIDMKQCPYWNGTVSRFRIDPFEITSPTNGAYTVLFDEILFTAEATLRLENGYDTTGVQTLTVPAYVPYDLTALTAPEREGYTFLGYTDGKTDTILSSVSPEKDMTLYAAWERDTSIVWNFADGLFGWGVQNGISKGVTNGVWSADFSTTNADLWLYKTSDLSIDASKMRYVVVEMRHNLPSGSTGSKPFEVFFTRTTDTPWQQHLSANISVGASADYVTYVVDMNTCSNWNGTINRLRIDPFEVKSTDSTTYTLDIKSIRVSEAVKLTLNGGYDGATVRSHTLPSGVAVTLSDYTKPSREGYTFVGWSREPQGTTIEALTPTKDTTLYAVWKPSKSSLSLTADEVRVSLAEENGALVVVSYNNKGRVLDVVVYPVTKSEVVSLAALGLDKTGSATVKAFLFDSMTELVPLCQDRAVATAD